MSLPGTGATGCSQLTLWEEQRGLGQRGLKTEKTMERLYDKRVTGGDKVFSQAISREGQILFSPSIQ